MTTDTDNRTRAFEMEIELDHPADTVWHSLTDPDELARWFPLEARVEPGVGGSVYLSWEDPWFFDTRIEIWQPGERLRLLENRARDNAEVAMDFVLESRSGRTVLRLVHSGFGHGADWDDEYEGISRGWSYELRSLRHYLDRHRGKNRHMGWLKQPTEMTAAEAYARVLGPDGLLAAGSVAGLIDGDSYAMRSVVGDEFGGTVLYHRPPTSFAGIVPALDDAILRYECEGSIAVLALALWGDRAADARAFEKTWINRLADLLS